MSAPVYIGKHAQGSLKPVIVGEIVDRLKQRGDLPETYRCNCYACRIASGKPRPEPRHAAADLPAVPSSSARVASAAAVRPPDHSSSIEEGQQR